MSQSTGDKFRGALAWLNERKYLLLAVFFVALCNYYYFEIRYFSALHPNLCPVPRSGLQWSRFNNSPDAVALPRAYLFFVLLVAIFALYRGGRRYPPWWRFVFPKFYERTKAVSPSEQDLSVSTLLALAALAMSAIAAAVALCG